MRVLEREAAVTGVGLSAAGRRLGRSALDLTLDAILAAVADAGLSLNEVDGLCMVPGVSATPGMSPVPLRDVKNALDLKLNWFLSVQEGPGQLAAVMNAASAVATGQAQHVVCFRTVYQYSARAQKTLPPPGAARRVDGWHAWAYPFNALSAVHAHAMMTQLRMERFGLTRRQLAGLVLNSRRNAARNPSAVYREPLTLDDYLSARMIAEPLCLLDCDAPIDGSTAVVVSSWPEAQALRKPPLRIEAMSGALYGVDSWDQFDDLTTMAARDAGQRLWARTSLRPSDVDLANVYDGFSIQALVWLEALGFCGEGESGAFVEGGDRIALDGDLPVNTGGGQLSAGRLHGFGLLHESCIQLWGEGGARQVPCAPRVAVTAAGGGPLGGCLLMTRD